jgi:tetratricopeptide (TPR) repeat protein
MGDTIGADKERQLASEISKSTIGRQSAIFNTNSGIRLLNSEDIDGAIAQFQSAIKLAPDYAVAHFYLGRALQKKGRTIDANLELQRAYELDPEVREMSSQ